MSKIASGIISCFTIGVVFIYAFGGQRRVAVARDIGEGGASGDVPVVIELFTSEGCATCPPADDVLAQLDEKQLVAGARIIVLSQHVDYWNNLGWTDPFSSHVFSERQSAYARVFGKKEIYTPQMIVDGRTEFPGSKRDMALQTIAQAAREPKAQVQLSLAGDAGSNAPQVLNLSVRIDQFARVSEGGVADVLLAITESNLTSNVARGENHGRRLSHVGVVRKLYVIGNLPADSFTAEPIVSLDKNWRRKNLRAVVFVQERASKHVIGAAMLKLAQ